MGASVGSQGHEWRLLLPGRELWFCFPGVPAPPSVPFLHCRSYWTCSGPASRACRPSGSGACLSLYPGHCSPSQPAASGSGNGNGGGTCGACW